MRPRSTAFLTIVALLMLAVSPLAQQRLFVVGGGGRPVDGVKKFVEWAGGPKAKILAITWASGEPEPSYAALKKDFESAGGSVEHAPTRPLDAEKKKHFVSLLNSSTAVFFSGGDQNRIMDELADEELLKPLREKYARGMPFGGTSAGAAAISDPMMTGDADLKILDGSKVGVRPGLGLIPNVMFDQHFLVRQRHSRLFGFVMKNPGFIGIGIDEDNAVLIEDNRKLSVAGTTWVMFVRHRDKNGEMAVDFLKPGERFDLRTRKRER